MRSASAHRPRLGRSCALGAAFFAIFAFSACRTDPEPPKRASPSKAPASGADGLPRAELTRLPSSEPEAPSRPAASAVIEIRQRVTSLAAPPPLPRHIALGKGFVLQIRDGEVVALDSTDGQEITRVPMRAPRAALALPAGSVLVAALEGSYRFDPRQKRGHAVSRLSLLPGFVLEPRRESQEQVWVLQAPQKTLQRYALGPDAGLGLESERVLSDYDGGSFSTLRDGSLLYTSGNGAALVHVAGAGDSKPLALPPGVGAVWRLAAADRVDRAWAVTSSGDVLLLELAAPLRIARTIRTGLAPLDFAATANRFALVSVIERASEPRRFSLHVYSGEGSQIYSHTLGLAEVTAEPDWASHALANREVVVGETPPRVAVGGSASLRVFELESGKELLAR